MNWFNQVDAANRADAKDLAEAYYARFDSRLGQRLAETKAELRTEMAALRADMIKWMFIFWVGTVATNAGLLFAAVNLLR